VRILFVCMGNICRSPSAEGVFRRVLQTQAPGLNVEIDSAGTHGYHVGEPPDRRAVAAASRRGIDLSGQRARQVVTDDFTAFDLIVAMDEQNAEARLDVPGREGRREDVRMLGLGRGRRNGSGLAGHVDEQ